MKRLALLLSLLIPVFTFSQIINIPDDYPTIQQGIDAAVNGDTVLVDAGTYYENIKYKSKAITVASKYLITSDTSYISNTIIDGSQPSNPDSASVVMFVSGEDTTSILTGFTITGGSGTILQTYGWKGGGGIVCIESSVKITNNKIIANEVIDPDWAGGGGIACVSITSDHKWAIIEDNVISENVIDAPSNNAFGGGVYSIINTTIRNNLIEENSCISLSLVEGAGIMIEESTGSTIDINVNDNIIRNNELKGEKARGAGLNIQRAGISIENNEIYGNRSIPDLSSLGVGLFISGSLDNVLIQNNMFKDNTASIELNSSAGGGINIWNAGDIEVNINGNLFVENVSKNGGGVYSKNSRNLFVFNNVFTNNSSTLGAGLSILIQSSNLNTISDKKEITRPLLINNTFNNNTAGEKGGAIYLNVESNTPIIFNDIFWENEAVDGNDIYYLNGIESILISYCNISEENIIGYWTGIGNINSDPEFIDTKFHIDTESPCFGAGIDSVIYENEWYSSPKLDFEDDPRPSYGAVDIGADEYFVVGLHTPLGSNATPTISSYPNPFTSSITIEYEFSHSGTVTITFYNQFGKEMDRIEQKQSVGKQQITWNAEGLPAGIYYFRLNAGEQQASGKVVLVR